VARIIGIISGKGGVGKTISTVNLALALQELGESVTVVDADMTVSNLGVQLGTFKFETSLQDVLDGRDSIINAIHPHPSGLMIIPSSISVDDIYTSVKTDPKKLRRELQKLKGTIVMDCPPGLTDDALSAMQVCDDVIVVTNPEVPAVTDAIKVIKIARDLGKDVLGVVVNRIQGEPYELKPAEIEIMCEAPVISRIPEDKAIKRSIFEETPVLRFDPYARSSIEFRRLAHHLTNKQFREPRFVLVKKLLSSFI